MFYAHSTPRRDRCDWQRLADHLTGVAARSGRAAAKFGAVKAGQLAGLLHDLGKYSPDFQRRLQGRAGSVDHSTAGAREVVRRASGNILSRRLSETLAYAIAGHHAGLPDRHGGPGSLAERMTRAAIPTLDPAWTAEIDPGPPGSPMLDSHPESRSAFQLAFHGRMIFSALVDADRRDTEDHAVRTGHEAARPRGWPSLGDCVEQMIEKLDAHLNSLPRAETNPQLNAIRARVLQALKARAPSERGLYTLTVPTGGGKTLSVMRFALGHAAHHRASESQPCGVDRIVIAIPFTSVIDQTAGVLKGIFGEDLILEHHSAIELESAEKERQFRERDEGLNLKLRLAMEDWAAPVIVTTNVQLFESLFSHRPSRCRKLHNLANSIIILDEAQTIPLHLLRPCLAALDELARNYGCTIVICTATQPAVGAPEFIGGLELGPERELAPDPAGLHEDLCRATIHVQREPMADRDLVEALRGADQGFVIVNSRKHALALFRTAERDGLKGLIHLTTRQYAAHRRRVIEDIKVALDPENPKPCRLVATSLIEAGIDLDFGAGWRAKAGLESIVQSAGRVNREGRRPRDDSVLTVFTPADAENEATREVVQLAAAMDRLGGEFGADLASPRAIERYFREVYWQKGDGLDEIVVEVDGRKQKRSVLGCFRLNGAETDFAYETVGENFRMIDEQMLPVIIATEPEARRALERLNWRDVSMGSVARDLQTFIVQVPKADRARLLRRGDVQFRREDRFGEQFAVLEAGSLYDDSVGLLWEDNAELGATSTIF